MNGIEIRTKCFCNSRRVNCLLPFAMMFVFFLLGLFLGGGVIPVNYGMGQGNLSYPKFACYGCGRPGSLTYRGILHTVLCILIVWKSDTALVWALSFSLLFKRVNQCKDYRAVYRSKANHFEAGKKEGESDVAKVLIIVCTIIWNVQKEKKKITDVLPIKRRANVPRETIAVDDEKYCLSCEEEKTQSVTSLTTSTGQR